MASLMHRLLILSLFLFGLSAKADSLVIAAASSLRPVLGPRLIAWGKEQGIEVQVVYGASGSLVQQMLRGAPFAVFVSAAPAHLRPLLQAGKVCGGPLTLGQGRLVLYLPPGSPVPLRADLKGLDRARRVALANPAVAPFGVLARQALQRAGLWSCLASRRIIGESASQAGHFALSGAVDAALLPKRLVQEPAFAEGRWTEVAPHLYETTPIQAVRLCDTPPAAKTVFGHLTALFAAF